MTRPERSTAVQPTAVQGEPHDMAGPARFLRGLAFALPLSAVLWAAIFLVARALW